MNQSLRFRRAQAKEADLLTALAGEAKRHWGYPAEWMKEWRNELTVTPDYVTTQPVYVGEMKAEIVGFFGLKLLDSGQHLEHLWLRPAFIGLGLGRLLFAEAVEKARDLGVTELRIKSDPNAEAFYLKMGAVRIGSEVYQMLDNIRREVPYLAFYIR